MEACAGDDHQVVTAAVLGHKADVAFMALGPDPWRLRDLQTALAAAGLDVVAQLRVHDRAVGVRAELPDDMKSPGSIPSSRPRASGRGASTP